MPTVLVVDDTEVIRETVAKLLRLEGFATICASSGKEALAALKVEVPDAVLMDIMMPEMDGIECLELLRQDSRYRTVPVIMMSALSDDEHQRRARELGATDYLVKARCSINQMLDRIRSVIPDTDARN